MRSVCLSLLVLALTACGSDDDPSFADGGVSAGDATNASICPPLIGSCRPPDGSCYDIRAGGGAMFHQDQCESLEGLWSSRACDTGLAVGGCELVGGAGQPCVTVWLYPPETAEELMAGCVAPHRYVPAP